MSELQSISPTLARRLAIMCQHLAGPHPSADSKGIMEVIGDLGYVQIDPVRVVERSHLLVLWSRLGRYDPVHLDKLLWSERKLFQDWAQATSIVLTEDYPIFKALKRTFATGDDPWAKRIRSWTKKNEEALSDILNQLYRKSPLPSDSFKVKFVEDWRSSGWTAGRNVDVMLYILWAQGRIMIAGRRGTKKIWELTERFLPKWAPKEELSDKEVFRLVTRKSLRALGIAPATHIMQHYIRRCYGDIESILAELEAKGQIRMMEICEEKKKWRGRWYICAEDLPLLERLMSGEWEPRTTLLSPFDNLIANRQRTAQLFGFHFSFELYVPKFKRKYGAYTMPILHGDSLIGRVDSRMDRKQKRLIVNAVYAEPHAPMTKEVGKAIASAIDDLGEFLGAEEIVYGKNVPRGWKTALS